MKKLNKKHFLQTLFFKNQKGYVISIIMFFILILMMTIAISIAVLTSYMQRVSTNSVKSTQSYYASEAGLEDALLRLSNNPAMSALSYTLDVNGAVASIVIPDILGSARVVTSDGNNANVIKKLQAVYSVDTQGVSFHYGAQVGAGGLTMDNNSAINGNVFSNGNITGSGTINNNVIVATNGNKLDGPDVGGSVYAYICDNSEIAGNLVFVTGGSNNCDVDGLVSTQASEIATQSLPISQSQIDNWKAQATAGGVTTGNYSIPNNQTRSLGPRKITGDLIVGNGATLNITGTIYVQGNITLGNAGVILKLDNSYGSLGGTLLLDGIIDTGTGSAFNGTGQGGSYLLVLSTNGSDDAITIRNNTTGAVFYTSTGGIRARQNVTVKELTGYKLKLDEGVLVEYDSGLQSLLFTDGPSGSWKVTSWAEK